MSIIDWINNFSEDIRNSPKEAVTRAIYDGYVGALRRIPTSKGPNPISEDWNVLIILDACRPEQLKEVAPEYDWLPPESEIEVKRSPAGRSDDWMNDVFDDVSTESIIYITGNPFADSEIDESEFKNVIYAYRTHWDDELNAMPPRPITDYGISAARENNMGDTRIILHYMQPHFPSIPAIKNDQPTFGRGGLYQRWKRVQTGDITKKSVIDAYRDNLRFVLDEVSLLQKNIPVSEITISADHGTSLGEWGIYGHSGLPISVVRNVPWVTVEASDSGHYQPNLTIDDNSPRDIENQLSALGYR